MRYNKTSEDSMRRSSSAAKDAAQEHLSLMQKNSKEFFKKQVTNQPEVAPR